jgi:hypothetical protein
MKSTSQILVGLNQRLLLISVLIYHDGFEMNLLAGVPPSPYVIKSCASTAAGLPFALQLETCFSAVELRIVAPQDVYIQTADSIENIESWQIQAIHGCDAIVSVHWAPKVGMYESKQLEAQES